MRLLSALLMAMILAVSALSQQSNENKEQPKPEAKKTAPEKQSQQPQKPEEAQPKSTEPAPSQPQPKPGEDAKAEHYDMTEVAPVVTHHQISVNGKPLPAGFPLSAGMARSKRKCFSWPIALTGKTCQSVR